MNKLKLSSLLLLSIFIAGASLNAVVTRAGSHTSPKPLEKTLEMVDTVSTPELATPEVASAISDEDVNMSDDKQVSPSSAVPVVQKSRLKRLGTTTVGGIKKRTSSPKKAIEKKLRDMQKQGRTIAGKVKETPGQLVRYAGEHKGLILAGAGTVATGALIAAVNYYTGDLISRTILGMASKIMPSELFAHINQTAKLIASDIRGEAKVSGMGPQWENMIAKLREEAQSNRLENMLASASKWINAGPDAGMSSVPSPVIQELGELVKQDVSGSMLTKTAGALSGVVGALVGPVTLVATFLYYTAPIVGIPL